MTKTFSTPLSGALAMAERGWCVIPVRPPGEVKAPAIRGWKGAATTDERQIRDWAEQFPGCNFGIATESSGLVVLDEDTPGALDKWAESESIGRPETFSVSSGREGGGTHFWYRTETEYKASSPMKRAGYDVDVRARGGFVVCPGSIHASGAVYKIVNDVEPVALPEAIAVYLRLPNERMYETEPPSELLSDLYGEGYLDATRQHLRQDLDEAAAAPLGAAPRWETAVMHVAYRLVELSNCSPSLFPRDEALAYLMKHAPQDDGFDSDDIERKFAHACAEKGYTGGRENIPDGGADDDFGGGGNGSGKGNGGVSLAVQLRDHVDSRYDVFPAEDDGRVYLQRRGGGRAELLSRNAVIRAGDGLGSGYATLSSAASEAAAVLGANAQNRLKVRPRPLALRVHHDRRRNRIILDLGRSWSARCVVVTADGWSIEDAPPPGVSFLLPGRALPEPERGGDLEELRDHLRWEAHDPRWPLIKGWLPGALLANVPRPTLGLFGPQGSAKTTTGRFVASLLDPKPPGALGGGLGKNLKNDETKALKSYIPAWDNVSHLSGEAADFLSRMGTGENAERRQLYSDTELVSVFYRRTSIITGITVPSGIKPDTLDRMLIVNFERLAGERISEGRLEDEWERVQPRALAGMLDLAVEMLRGLPTAKNPENLRMGDYAEGLWAIDPALYDAYAAAYGSAKAEMAADDPFVQTVLRWLRNQKDHSYEGTPEDAFNAASWAHEEADYWPDSVKGFGRQVVRAEELLPEVGVTTSRRKSHGQRLIRFTLTEDS